MANTTFTKNIGSEAVKKLRASKFAAGLPFMINSSDLPVYQFYLEYPEGKIFLAALVSGKKDFSVIREMTPDESKKILRDAQLGSPA